MRVILLSDLLWVQSPKVVCMQDGLVVCHDIATLIGVLGFVQFVADVLTSVVAFELVNYHQRPVDDGFECLKCCHGLSGFLIKFL